MLGRSLAFLFWLHGFTIFSQMTIIIFYFQHVCHTFKRESEMEAGNEFQIVLRFFFFKLGSVFFFNLILFLNFKILYWFCQISKWIRHRYTCVPHPELSSFLPPHTIPLGRPSAPAPSIQYRASNLDWRLVSYMIYVFQCHSPKSSHPLPLPQSPKDCSIHQCLFYCLVHRVIVTIFLNSIYMC